MNEREENILTNEATSVPPAELDWAQEKTKVRVRQFMNILEQLPRLCSPTICGTLSQPTTRAERASRGADLFEWSLEQKAILSPANITTDTDGTDEWQHNVADLNPSWRQQESEMFFSQRTIAPSPMISTPCRIVRKPIKANFQDLMLDEEDETDDEMEPDEFGDEDGQDEAQDLTTRSNDTPRNRQQSSQNLMSYILDDGCEDEDEKLDNHHNNCSSPNDESHFYLGHPRVNELNNDAKDEQDEYMDSLFFSPQPLKSSQTQQRMDVFSPDSFVRVMEADHTLQSTPKTTGSLTRTRTRTDVLD